MSKKSKLIHSEFSRKKGRTLGLASIVATLALVMFSGLIIIFSLNNGISSLSQRMGADLMIVPLGYESGAEGVLIKGEPSYFYFDKSVLSDIKNSGVEGIDKITAQFYLTSSSQGCCDIPVQFIGIDEETDFTVLPWIRESFGLASDSKINNADARVKTAGFLEDGSIVVGSDIDVPEDGKIRFFDEYFRVSAQLEETGTGLDQAVFTNFATSLAIYTAARKKGFNFTGDMKPDDSISTIMIKVKDGYTPEQVKHDIRTKIDGLQIIETKSLSNSIRGSLSGFVVLLYVLIIMLLILTLIILSVTFRLSVKERVRQFTLMRTIGATKKQVNGLILRESLIISFLGTVAGISLAAILIFPFSNAISLAVSIPFLLPNALEVIIYIAVILVIGSLSGPISAIGSMKSLDKISVYEAAKN
ncbi:MAG: ABC transporter permease [Eubacterium sp.]|nr:ABC transporter permease [Eubacterium sp.]